MAAWLHRKSKAATEGAAAQAAPDERHAPRLERKWKRILVPAFDMPYSMRSLEVAYRLAQGSGAIVKLAFVIEVPRALPMEAPMPDSESVAEDSLRAAQEAARPFNVAAEPFVQRTRSAPDGILKLINQESIDLIVLGGRPDSIRGLSRDLMHDLFKKAPCEVVLDYIADEK